jgi:hypothetical protein
MDPPLHQSIRIHKSTKLLDFTYSSSFTFFLAYIHYLSRHSSYKKKIFYPLWQQVMDKELFAYVYDRYLRFGSSTSW